MITSIVLTGVGGQGVLLAAKLIASAAGFDGHQVCSNEIHGMAQRGGSVTAQLRYGDSVFSPLTLEGTADVIFAMEHIEALRYAHYLKPSGFAVVSKRTILPLSVSAGHSEYPSDIAERLAATFSNLKYVDCQLVAAELGNPRLENTLLTGVLSRKLSLKQESWLRAIEICVKPEFIDPNIEAFKKGQSL